MILTPLVAQNYGAKQKQRLDQVIAYSGRMTVYWGIVLYVLLLIFAGIIGSIFTDDPEVIRHTKTYLYIVGLSLPAFGLALITASFFNGVYEPKASLKLTLVKSLVFTIPFAIIGSFFGLLAVWVGLALSNFAGATYADKLLSKWQRKNDSSLVDYNRLGDYVNDFKRLFGRNP